MKITQIKNLKNKNFNNRSATRSPNKLYRTCEVYLVYQMVWIYKRPRLVGDKIGDTIMRACDEVAMRLI
jgi:hypothetical protein